MTTSPTAAGSSVARSRPVIAIDGPGGSGKSTAAKGVARRLGWRYLDSGAMYRAVTVAVIEQGIDPLDPVAVAAAARRARLELSTDPDDPWTDLDGVRVSERIRSRAVTNAVSTVSAVPEVRATLLSAQRAIIGSGAIVVEGRDIGTTVCPDADLKIFLTADAEARAARRHRDTDAPEHADLEITHTEINRRDALDAGRAVSPLAKAADAIEIDTTRMSVDEVVHAIVEHYTGAHAAESERTEAEA